MLIAEQRKLFKILEDNARVSNELWRLYKIMQAFKGNSEKEREYMNAVAFKEEGRKEGERVGKEKGREDLTKLLKILNDSGRIDEISKVINDKEYQEKLLKEYNLF